MFGASISRIKKEGETLSEREELAAILKKYNRETVELYKKITKLERENMHRARRSEVREKIKDMISEVVR